MVIKAGAKRVRKSEMLNFQFTVNSVAAELGEDNASDIVNHTLLQTL